MINFLDIRTILLSYLITNIVSTFVLFLIWLQIRKRYNGTIYWIYCYIFQSISIFLIALRGHIPDWISIIIANALSVLGILIGYIGLEKFLNKKSVQFHNYILIIAFTFIHSWFSIVNPDLSIRNLNVAIVSLLLYSQIIWLLLGNTDKNIRQLTMRIGHVFIAFWMLNLFRIVDFFAYRNHSQDYLHSGSFEIFVIVIYQMLSILLTFSLTLTYNKKLLNEISTQEERFSKAFHSSPYALLLTGFPNGEIIEFNQGYLNISGYNTSEIVGKTTNDLHHWAYADDRVEVINQLSSFGKVERKEYQFRKKSGEIISCMFSSEIIMTNNEKCVISSINDISDLKNAEAILQESKNFAQSTIDALPEHLCVLDEKATIISVNQAWKEFADQNPPAPKNYWIGENYLKICNNAEGEFSKEAKSFGFGLLSVLNNEKDFFTFEYPCHSPNGEKRWFVGYIKRFSKTNTGQILIIHNNITARKQAEKALIQKLNELEHFNELTVNREIRMIELKKEINQLLIKLGEKTKYNLSE